MAGEIRPIFSKEAEEQLKSINNQISLIYGNVKDLDKIKLNFKTFKDYQTAVKKQSEATDELTKSQKKLQNASERLAFAQSEEGKELSRIREQTIKVNKENKAAAKDATTAASGYDRLRLSLNKAEKEYRDLAAVQGLASEETKQAQKRVQELREEVDGINEPIKRFGDNVGNYASAVPGFEKLNGALAGMGVSLGEIAEGGSGATASFAAIKKGIVSATQASLRFIATPIGAFIVGLAGIAVATKAFFAYNNRVGETNVLVERLANTTGDATDKLREQATAIENAYGKDFKEIVKELSDLQKDFGINAEEAFDIYNDGLARGGAASSEFGDSIREYGTLFADSGFSAQEFVDILNTGIDLGVYNDKLPDAIKEAGISLKEQTTATRESLVNAFGASFTNDILRQVNSGEKTIKEALVSISQEAKTAGLNQQQLAQLTADVFRGAGEDAGGAQKVFEALTRSIDLQKESLSDYSESVKRSAELFNDLEDAKTRAFKSDDAIAFTQAIKNASVKIKTDFFNAIAIIREGFNDVIFSIRVFNLNFNTTFEQFPKLVKAAFSDILRIFDESVNTIISYGNAIKSALSGDILSASTQIKAIKGINFQLTSTQSIIQETQKLKADGLAALIDQQAKEKKLLIEQANLEKQLNQETESKIKGDGEKNPFNVAEVIKQAAADNEAALLQAQEKLSQQYQDGTIEGEEFINGLAQAQKDYNAILIQDTIDRLNKVLLLEELNAEETEDVIEALAEFRIKAQQESINAIEEQAKKELETLASRDKQRLDAFDKLQKELADKKEEQAKEDIEREEEKQEQINEIKQAFAQVGFEALTAIGNEFFERQGQAQEDELNAFIENQDKRLEYINELETQGAISAEEAAQRRIKIEEETAARQAEIRRKQAIQDKAQALFNIAINAAQGITAALASLPPNPILAGSIAATGAIQAALVASQPIPQFYKGTESSPEGLAWVGERGEELLEFPDGTQQLASQEALTWLPKGTKVHTAEQTKDIKDKGLEREVKGLRSDLRKKTMSVGINVNNNSRIDYYGL